MIAPTFFIGTFGKKRFFYSLGRAAFSLPFYTIRKTEKETGERCRFFGVRRLEGKLPYIRSAFK